MTMQAMSFSHRLINCTLSFFLDLWKLSINMKFLSNASLQFFQIVFFNEVSGPLKIVGVLLVLMAMVGVGLRSILHDRRKRNK